MDANEALARTRLTEVLSRIGIGGAADADAETARVIREARAENERAKRDFHMHESELLSRIGASSLEDLDRELSRYVNVGFPYRNDHTSAIARTVKQNLLGKQVPSIIAQRHAIEKWLEDFDAVAQRMGYRKT